MAVVPSIADPAARVPAAGARAEAPPACCRRPARQRRQVRTPAHSGAALDAQALATARGLARSRCDVLEPASVDKFAERLAVEDDGTPSPPCTDAAAGARVTAFLDEQLLLAAHIIHPERQQEYNQVVVISPGMDTRAYRLMWPAGVVFYEVATAEVHSVAASNLKKQDAHIPRGCLLRRVAWDFQRPDDLQQRLEAAGFRGDRLSLWGIQGLHHLGFGLKDMQGLLLSIVNLAAYDSIVLGELPSMAEGSAQNLIAEYNLLGQIEPLNNQHTEESARRWLFTAKHKKLSASETNTYTSHLAAAEETDEDFFGNFS